jgi:dephospho-CoA kinase
MVLGITGGIASGKSLVTSLLEKMGPPCPFIIDADQVYRDLTLPGSPLCASLSEAFGAGMLTAGGTPDRKKLAALIFSSEDARLHLNALTHPAILKEIQCRREAHKNEHVVLSAPLLIEAGLMFLVDELWLVMVDEHKQVERLMNREHISEDDALHRVGSQMPLPEKKRYARHIIDNSGTPEETRKIVETLWKEAMERCDDRSHR